MSIELVAAFGAAVCAAAALAQLDGAGVPPAITGRFRRSGAGALARTGETRSGAVTGGSARPGGRLVAGIVGACVGLVVGGPAGAVGGVALGIVAATWAARRGAGRRRRAWEHAAPALARAIADALHGGASVRGALTAAGHDRSVPAPLRHGVADLARGIAFGAPLDTALSTLGAGGGPGLRLLCGAIALHLEAGGALARELRRIAADAEVATRIDEDRVAATAQARATVRVVAALPVLALVGAELVSRDFLPTIASQPIPLALLTLGLALEVAAIGVARMIVGGRA